MPNAPARDGRRCLLSGASGYVGSEIKRGLEADGWRVVELSRQPRPGSDSIRFRLGEPVDPELLKGYQALVHCAYDFDQIGWENIRTINVVGSELLLRAAHQAGVERIAFISTISAFHGCRSLYGKGKLEVEAVAHALGAWVIRPGLVYGETGGGMFGKLIKQVQSTSVVPIPGYGSQLQYMVNAADLKKAVSSCLEPSRASSKGPVTLAHEQPWAFRSILQAIAGSMNRRLVLVPVPWRLMWIGLRTLEALHIRLGLTSDSLVSLVNQNTKPRLNAFEMLGVRCSAFDPVRLSLGSSGHDPAQRE